MISVVMPAFNEAALLDQSVGKIVSGLRARDEDFEIHIVENGSTDATVAVATAIADRAHEVHVHSMPEPDYGEALRTGLLAANGEIAVIFDVDYFSLDFLDPALKVLDRDAVPAGPVVVVGSKRMPGASDERTALRRIATWAFSEILRRGFGLKVSDTHGMKVLNLAALAPTVAECQFGTDLFDTELIIRAERGGFMTAEIPVVVHELRPSRTPMLRRVPRTLVGLARLRLVLGRAPK